mgnify:FL=1
MTDKVQGTLYVSIYHVPIRFNMAKGKRKSQKKKKNSREKEEIDDENGDGGDIIMH